MNDDEWSAVGFLIWILAVCIDLLLFALEITLEAVILCFTIVWAIVCMVLDFKQSN